MPETEDGVITGPRECVECGRYRSASKFPENSFVCLGCDEDSDEGHELDDANQIL